MATVASRKTAGYYNDDDDDETYVIFTDSGNYIIMDIATSDSRDVIRSSSTGNNFSEKRKSHSFMEKLMGVKNTQCELYLARIHRDLDNHKHRQVRTLQEATNQVEYDYKVMQVDLKKQEIARKKNENPRIDTSLDEVLVEKSARYLQSNSATACYLERSPRIPIRRTIKSDSVSATVQQARKALQDQAVEKQLEKANEERKLLQTRKSVSSPSKRGVHFETDAMAENDTHFANADDKSEFQTIANFSEAIKSSESATEKEGENKSTRKVSSPKAAIVSYSSSAPSLKIGYAHSASVAQRPETARAKLDVNDFKTLLTNDAKGKTKQAQKRNAVKGVDRTDIHQWAAESTRYQNAIQNGYLPNIHRKSSTQTDDAENETSEKLRRQTLNILESDEDKERFMKLVSSWNMTGRSGARSSQSWTRQIASRSVVSGASSRKPQLTFDALKREQQRLSYRIKNFCRQLAIDKARDEEEQLQREHELRERAKGTKKSNDDDDSDDDVIERALSSSRYLKPKSAKLAYPPTNTSVHSRNALARDKARSRWQSAIRKVIDNLDGLVYTDKNNKIISPSYQAKIDSHGYKSGGFTKGIESKSAKSRGFPSNAAQRSKRHTATFKLRQVVQQLLNNNSTVQRIEYEQAKLNVTSKA